MLCILLGNALPAFLIDAGCALTEVEIDGLSSPLRKKAVEDNPQILLNLERAGGEIQSKDDMPAR